MIVNAETPDQPEVRDMLARLDAYCAALYPAESNHLMDIASLMQGDALFLVARDVDGAAVGCAALVNKQEYGEVKRMFVDERKRGLGTGRKLLEHLVMFARMSGLSVLRLETGIHQPEAIGLYERLGFERRAPFGDYREDPLSLFMEMPL
ncbi:GNAT family N-acetyltransferase [Massilia sp. NEAU-DD11]|uniref:GNAT family N-acetyltransferase n=1 Tax=Massilia cellulosiltytica TaxID=2683234 RepID=A0A7X3G171_9BURK|nr:MULTISPECIES: GNAT family N-acetyltransferase [Telluria group]KQZ53607.1 GCN5 family acetyltransferase [Massilia sp. Root1485]MVW61796.1 GNAT family N-acetyltransferase [Telluria cellulosilytica]